MSTRALQDYLKAIYKLTGEANQPVSTSALAERLAIAQPSVSGMVKKLAAEGLIEHVPYQGVRLTDVGRRVAVETIRKHRIVEQFLVQVLGLSWDEVDAEAEVLEHCVSKRVVNQMWEVLGRPLSDPHGSPIPPPDEDLLDSRVLCALSKAPLHVHLRLVRLSERRPDELRYFAERGIVPGARVWIEERVPLSGALMLRVGERSHVLDRALAQALLVDIEGVECI
ncbi:MAG: metal-dependent transcriptional regulator [Halothiobacillaceae bacterium]